MGFFLSLLVSSYDRFDYIWVYTTHCVQKFKYCTKIEINCVLDLNVKGIFLFHLLQISDQM